MPRAIPLPKHIMMAALVALGGCGSTNDRALEVVVIGEPGTPFSGGNRLPYSAQLVRSATAEGLVSFDEQGRVVPALADRWIVTDGGQSYIFRLRDGKWPDGTRINADSARIALQQAMTGARGTALAQDLRIVTSVRTMAGRVIEVRLARPFPDLLQLLAQPELGLTRRGRGAGPMKLSREGRTAVLSLLPPAERGLADEEDWANRIRQVRLRALPAVQALQQFDEGKADLVMGGRIEDFPRIDLGGFSRGGIRLDPVAGLFGLAVVNAEGFLERPENREAIAMAIDRDALLTPFNLSGWVSTTRIVTPGLEGDTGTIVERWQGRSLEERRANARARVADWQQSGSRPVLRVAMPAGPGGELLYKQIARDLAAIGLGTRRVGETAPADLRLIDTIARYPRPAWFLNQLSCANARAVCSAAADLFAAKALAEPDPTLSADLFAQAEAQLTMINGFIPFGVPVRWSLLGANAYGFAPNGWNVHPLMPMATLPK